jgi:hypothetical protein
MEIAHYTTESGADVYREWLDALRNDNEQAVRFA